MFVIQGMINDTRDLATSAGRLGASRDTGRLDHLGSSSDKLFKLNPFGKLQLSRPGFAGSALHRAN